MAKMPVDANAKPIPALRPFLSEDLVSTTSAPMTSDVARLVSSTGGTYTIGGAVAVPLPANVVEYIRVLVGETILVSGTFTITQMG